MDPRAKLPDEIEIKPPSAEYIAAAAAAEAAPPPEAVEAKPAIPVDIAASEGEEPEPLPLGEPPAAPTKVKKSRVVAKRLKKVAKEVRDLGVDAEVESEGGDEA